MYKKLVRSMLTVIFGALMITSVSLAVSSSSALAEEAKKGNEYTDSNGKHVCICEVGDDCQPCGNLTLE